MIMGGDSKKLATLIVSRIGDRAEEGKKRNMEAFDERASEQDSSDIDEGLLTCAEEIIAAVHSKDAKALAVALADFDEIHDAHEGEESEEEEAAEHPILGG